MALHGAHSDAVARLAKWFLKVARPWMVAGPPESLGQDDAADVSALRYSLRAVESTHLQQLTPVKWVGAPLDARLAVGADYLEDLNIRPPPAD